MIIETVKLQDNGYLVNGTMCVPTSQENRHYRMVQEWIAKGNIPDVQYTEAEIVARDVAEANQIVYAELEELDKQSIRDIREWITLQENAPQGLKDREAQAVSARGRLQ